MDLNLVRSLTTLALFVLFVILMYKVFSKKSKKQYEEAANLPFVDGDERSQQINQKDSKGENHE